MAELLCFGESFLQGFDALNWNYEHDRHIAVSSDSGIMQQLSCMTVQYGVDLIFGYIEKCGDSIYSSCAMIEKGKLIHNYRRISKGWEEYSITDEHYKEGTCTEGFSYHDRPVKIALCGDMWDFPEKFKTDGLLIWPVYVNFGLDEWEQYEIEYAEQAFLAADRTGKYFICRIITICGMETTNSKFMTSRDILMISMQTDRRMKN